MFASPKGFEKDCIEGVLGDILARLLVRTGRNGHYCTTERLSKHFTGFKRLSIGISPDQIVKSTQAGLLATANGYLAKQTN